MKWFRDSDRPGRHHLDSFCFFSLDPPLGVYALFMRRITLGFFLTGLALHAQPDLLIQSPAVIAKCAPQYTPEAKRANIEGTVVLYIQVYPTAERAIFDFRAVSVRVLTRKLLRR